MNELIEHIQAAVLTGNYENIKEITQKALNVGVLPDDIIKDGVLGGIEAMHKNYDKDSKVFPTDVLFIGYEAARECLEIVLPLREKKDPVATVVLGTPQGDVHDVGGKWLAITLMAAGYNVEYLGRDVKPQEFVNKAIETHAQVIALSCHQTTAYKRIDELLDIISKSELAGKVFVMAGGSAITEKFAKMKGLGYATSAVAVVHKLNERFGVLGGM